MRRLLSLVASLMLVASAFVLAPVAVEASGPECGSSEIQVTFYANSDYTPTSTRAWVCFVTSGAGLISVNNLTQRPAFCYETTNCITNCPRSTWSPIPDAWTWNDCISSIKVWSPSCHWGVNFYADSGYGSFIQGSWGPTFSVSLTTNSKNDQISSMYRAYRATCPV